jgi:oxygen-independent coproporphyrinogen-3 oxidase
MQWGMTECGIGNGDADARAAYIHVPFCARRCGYCSFTLVAGRDDLIEPYLEALARELSLLQTPREVDTLYIGGGTPTHLKGPTLARLLALVLSWHPPAVGHEFTVEANPGDLDDRTVAILADHGVTRVSLGAQSFDAKKLRALERDHTGADIRRSVDLVRSRSMAVSLDLIFAAPLETLGVWNSDLETAISLAPDHLSTYGLTYERGATFWSRRQRGDLAAADEELERAMYETAIDRLTEAGFEHYEVSNFARPGNRCRHNEAYWLGDSYFAAGPGAARYLDGSRSMNHRSTAAYIRRILAGHSAIAENERLAPRDRACELLVFALRRTEGVDRAWFRQRADMELDSLAGPIIEPLVDKKLMVDEVSHVRLTRAGLLISDAIFSRILTSNNLPA